MYCIAIRHDVDLHVACKNTSISVFQQRMKLNDLRSMYLFDGVTTKVNYV